MAITRYHSGGNVGRCEFHPINFGGFLYYNDRDCYYRTEEEILPSHPCTACAAGTFKSATGSAACDDCPYMSISPAASDAQTDCLL